MLRLLAPTVVAIIAVFAVQTPSSARGAGAVADLMLAELGADRPRGCPGRWCACYMDTALARAGLQPLGSSRARDFANYGETAEPGALGAIMVVRSHVGVVVGACENGDVMIVSGNYSNKVALGCYSTDRAIAWRAGPLVTLAILHTHPKYCAGKA